MADEIGTVAIVEEFVISPPPNWTSPTSAEAGENLLLGLATLKSVSFYLGKHFIYVQTTWFR